MEEGEGEGRLGKIEKADDSGKNNNYYIKGCMEMEVSKKQQSVCSKEIRKKLVLYGLMLAAAAFPDSRRQLQWISIALR